MHQSTRPSAPYLASNHSLACLKWPFPRKPLLALSGEGCCNAEDRIRKNVGADVTRAQGERGKRNRSSKTYGALQDKVFLLQEPPSGVSIQYISVACEERSTLSSFATRFAAHAPQARKTIPRPRPAMDDPCAARFAPPYLSITSMTLSVNSSQPLPECEPASFAFTVRQVLSSKTPFCAHAVRLLLSICQKTQVRPPPGCEC